MKQQSILVLAAVAITATAAFADVETHTVPYQYLLSSDGDTYPRLRFPGFDDQGGQRVLTRVDVRVQADVSATLAIENMTDGPLSDWSLEGQHIVLTALLRDDPKGFGPFAFLGGLFIDPITGTLSPRDGTPRSGDDYLSTTLETTIDSTLDMDPFFLPFFSGGGEVEAIIGPFTEFFLLGASPFDPKSGVGDATVEFAELAQAGKLSLIYEYTAVPEPTCGLAFAAGALLAIRRRR